MLFYCLHNYLYITYVAYFVQKHEYGHTFLKYIIAMINWVEDI